MAMSLWEAAHGRLPLMNVSYAEILRDGLFRASDVRLLNDENSANG